MKKTKSVILDVKKQSSLMGVLTRSKTLALQRVQNDSVEFQHLGSKRFKKLSGEVKKRQRRGDSKKLSKGNGKSGAGRRRKGGLKLEEGLEGKVNLGDKVRVKDDLGVVDLVGGIDLIGGVPPSIGGPAVVDDVLGVPANAGDSVVAGGGDALIGGGGDSASGGAVVVDDAKGGVDESAAISGGDGGERAELGGDAVFGDNVLVTGGNDRVTGENTPEHSVLISDAIRIPCSSTMDTKPVADEWPQTELGGNLHQHPRLTTDLLLQENSNYAPSMEKYNFDFENEKPLPGRFEWEKVQP